jgi:hypothetical protein
MVRIRRVERVRGTLEALGAIAEGVADACHDELVAHVDRELSPGDHVQLLLVEGRAVRVNFFVDVDGTLWIERVASS